MVCLHQGTSTVGQYVIHVCTSTSEAPVATFWEGPTSRIKDKLAGAGHDVPASLDDLVSLTKQIDIRFLLTRYRG